MVASACEVMGVKARSRIKQTPTSWKTSPPPPCPFHALILVGVAPSTVRPVKISRLGLTHEFLSLGQGIEGKTFCTVLHTLTIEATGLLPQLIGFGLAMSPSISPASAMSPREKHAITQADANRPRRRDVLTRIMGAPGPRQSVCVCDDGD